MTRKHFKYFGLKYPTNRLMNDDLEKKRKINLCKCINDKKENFVLSEIVKTGLKWKRQARWGMRIFDFWNHEKGIAVEFDGGYHICRKRYDLISDEANLQVSGIKVLRINSLDKNSIDSIIEKIKNEVGWNERRGIIGLNPIKSLCNKRYDCQP